jgi:hypothetical protein
LPPPRQQQGDFKRSFPNTITYINHTSSKSAYSTYAFNKLTCKKLIISICCNVLEVDDLISQLTRGKHSIHPVYKLLCTSVHLVPIPPIAYSTTPHFRQARVSTPNIYAVRPILRARNVGGF